MKNDDIKKIIGSIGFVVSFWNKNLDEINPVFMVSPPRIGETVSMYDTEKRYKVTSVEYFLDLENAKCLCVDCGIVEID